MTTGKQRACSCVTVFVAVALLTASAPAQTVWYVDDNAPNDPGPGDPSVSDPAEDGSFEHPFDAIQEAIDAAGNGDEVVILEGTYTGDGNRDLDFSNGLPGGQTRAIIVRSTNPEDPDVVAATVIDCQGTETEPHRGFKFHTSETANSVLAGLTITNGYGPEEDIGEYMRSVGGAIFCNGSNPRIISCNFIGNSVDNDGAGIYCYDSNPTITKCTISGNAAPGGYSNDGGGIYIWNSSPTVTDCMLSGNSAYCGGGICCYEGNPTITNCTIRDNSAVYGGGVRCWHSSPMIINCYIIGNSAESQGGIGCYEGSPTIINCQIADNFVNNGGGGFHCYYSSPTITNCTISINSSVSYRGGGIGCFYSDLTIINCMINANSAPRGGGIHSLHSNLNVTNCMISRNSASDVGGGMFNWYNSIAILTNCTISWNSAANGKALACDYSNQQAPSSVLVANCIFWDGGDEVWNNDGSTITIANSDIQNGWPGTGNIDADPLFVRDPDDGGDGWGDDPDTPGVDESANDDYGNLRLLPGSPCIDAGDNTAVPLDTLDLDDDGDTTERIPFDLDGLPRFIDMDPPGGSGVSDPPDYPEIVDMGAYESSPKAPADFDYDGDVDADDFGTFKACVTGPAIPYDPEDSPQGCWLMPDDQDIIAADFNADADVDQSDFGIFQRCYSGEHNPADPDCAD